MSNLISVENNGVEVNCRKCGGLFYVNVKTDIKEKSLNSNPKVKISYFECTECKHKYFTGICDDVSEEISKQIDAGLKSKADLLSHERTLFDVYEPEIDKILREQDK